jgi:AbrB family looped-hinge helix DNA binding protein
MWYYDAYIDTGGKMETVTVSPKYQVVIPSRVRRLLGVQPGQKVKVILYDNRIEMIPVRPIEETRGFLRGLDTSIEREPDRL